jgi:uncharacterized protein (TIGR02145 family)
MRLSASAAVISVCVLCGTVFAQSVTFIDIRDKNKYKTVVIGGKRWMAANLNYAPDSGNSWCYNDSASYCAKYGRLYDWETAKSACPKGYHLPSREEWGALVKAAGGEAAGKALKSKSGWKYEGEIDDDDERIDGNGTDRFGFSAKPGGYREYGGGYYQINEGRGYWWTSTEYGKDYAYYWEMYYGDKVDEDKTLRRFGYSVRCVGD